MLAGEINYTKHSPRHMQNCAFVVILSLVKMAMKIIIAEGWKAWWKHGRFDAHHQLDSEGSWKEKSNTHHLLRQENKEMSSQQMYWQADVSEFSVVK